MTTSDRPGSRIPTDSKSMHNINVTKTFLPPIEEYQEHLQKIWDNVWLTNQGPLLLEFEQKMLDRIDSGNFHFVANGTVALQLALRALDISGGEVITTPFTYVATTSAILWEHCTPVYVDIEPETFCIDPSKIEAAITSKTKAIMPVHVFGNPCDIEAIDAIAAKHNLKVIYDAAHAFGVTYKGKPLLNNGDISTCSFHSTKLFHTIEGGAVIAKHKPISDKLDLMKRFGHNGDDHIMLGINAKASEFHAAMGLCNLNHVDRLIKKRKAVYGMYDKHLKKSFKRPVIHKDTTYNYGYYPLVLKNEAELKKVVAELAAKSIFPRRYFYPSLNTLPYIKNAASCPVSEDISSRILCLPLSHEIVEDTVRKICEVINK
jgi:dTDP-4-amino-4,6-dideoxygalactose transaminase